MREPAELQAVDVTWVREGGRRWSCFAGSDYLRLSWHPEVRSAVARAVDALGPSASASRMTTGNLPVYGRLEAALSAFLGAGVEPTLVSAGYLAPMVAAQALASEHDRVALDVRAHACLVDAARLTGLPTVTFDLRKPAGWTRAFRAGRAGGRVLVMTDGLMPSGGEPAPVDRLLAAMPEAATLMVDDSHGAAVLGERGRGTVEHRGVALSRVVLCFTLSKAFGAYGGVVVGRRGMRRRILERSGIFTGNTPLSPPLAAGALAALAVHAREGADRRERLRAAVARVRGAFAEAGHPEPAGAGPVIAVAPRTRAGAVRLERRLRDAGIHPPRIRYPGGPAPVFFRFALSSEHGPEQVDTLRSVLVDFLRNERPA